MPHARHRLFSVGLAILMAMWSPLCCCLTSHAEASSESATDTVWSVQSHGPDCQGHGSTKPSEDEQAPASDPCQCPQFVAEQLGQAPDLLLSVDNGRELLTGPLLLLPNLLATAMLLDTEHSPRWLVRDADLPRGDAAPSLLTLRTLLTI